MIRKQYEAEWALDQVEDQIRDQPAQQPLTSEPQEWSLTSPGGKSVCVESVVKNNAPKGDQVYLVAKLGLRATPHARRRITARLL